MPIFRSSRRQEIDNEYPQPHPLDEVEATAAAFARAMHFRDAAIIKARASSEATLEDIAQRAGLSVSRIRQISPRRQPWEGGPSRPAVAELDLYLSGELHSGDRILTLREAMGAEPVLHETERSFLAENKERLLGHRYDIGYDLYDAGSDDPWTVVYIEHTRELYAFRHILNRLTHAFDAAELDSPADARKGLNRGPCILLGTVATYPIVAQAINPLASVLRHRPGGLAVLYGRVQLLNRTLKAGLSGPAEIFGPNERTFDYLNSV